MTHPYELSQYASSYTSVVVVTTVVDIRFAK